MKDEKETFSESISEIEGKRSGLKPPELEDPDGDGGTDDEERIPLSPTALFFLSR